MRRSLVLLVALTVAIVFTAVGQSRPNTSSRSEASAPQYNLTIGTMLMNTGTFAAFGPPYNLAAQLALNQINHAIEVDKLNIKVSLVTADSAGTPQGGVDAAQKLIANGATCTTGMTLSDQTIATTQGVFIPQKVPHITVGASSDQITTMDRQGMLFRLFPPSADLAVALTKAVAQRLHGAKGKLVAVSSVNTAAFATVAPTFAKLWKARGGKVTGPIVYDPSAVSYDTEAQTLAKGKPLAYVVADLIGGTSFANMSNALLRTGNFSGSQLFIAGGQVATVPPNVNPNAVNGTVGVQPSAPMQSAAYKGFLQLYNNSPNPPLIQNFTQNNFDAVILCFLASLAGRSPSGVSISTHLRALTNPPGKAYTYLQLPQPKALASGQRIRYVGASGDIGWNKVGDVSASLWAIYRYSGGKQHVIGTLSTAQK